MGYQTGAEAEGYRRGRRGGLARARVAARGRAGGADEFLL